MVVSAFRELGHMLRGPRTRLGLGRRPASRRGKARRSPVVLAQVGVLGEELESRIETSGTDLACEPPRGYVAVFEEDVVRHYQDFLTRRRAQRRADEYTTPTGGGVGRTGTGPARPAPRAEHEGWTGEIEGIDLTLRLLAEKKASAERAGRTRPA
jgi:GTPase involved in cell partitioning and DNA repair